MEGAYGWRHVQPQYRRGVVSIWSMTLYPEGWEETSRARWGGVGGDK